MLYLNSELYLGSINHLANFNDSNINLLAYLLVILLSALTNHRLVAQKIYFPNSLTQCHLNLKLKNASIWLFFKFSQNLVCYET